MTEKAKKLATKKIKSSFLEGIKLRECFAGLAMQTVIINNTTIPKEVCANMAVTYADALLEELAKEN